MADRIIAPRIAGLCGSKALIFSDQEQKDLVVIFDAAIKAHGPAIAPQTMRIYYELLQAGVVT